MVEQTICSKFFFVGQLLLVATWFSNVVVADGMTEKQMDARCSYISEAVDCSADGECYSGMCSCRNGASTYPVCQTNPGGTGCGGKCGYTEYCDKKMGKCMCLHGGKPGNCCKRACASGRSCLNGRCRCKYGRLPQSRKCRKCKPGTPGCKAPPASLSCENSIRVTCSQYRDVSQQLQINIAKVEQQVKQLEKEITLEKENCKKNLEKCKEYEKKNKELEKKVKDIENQLEDQKRKTDAEKEKSKELEKKKKELENKVKDIEKQLKDRERETDRANESKRNLEKKIKKLEEELDTEREKARRCSNQGSSPMSTGGMMSMNCMCVRPPVMNPRNPRGGDCSEDDPTDNRPYCYIPHSAVCNDARRSSHARDSNGRMYRWSYQACSGGSD